MQKRLRKLIPTILACGMLLVNTVFFETKAEATEDNTYMWPTPTVTEVVRGYPQGHKALDIACPMGTSVLASRGGVVEALYTGCNNRNGASGASCQAKGICNPSHGYYGGFCNEAYGNAVIIRHADGSYAAYAHLIAPDAELYVGREVAQGEFIGLTGSTGRASGAHLHFECRYASEGGYWRGLQFDPATVVTPTNYTPPTEGDYTAFVLHRDTPDFTDVSENDWFYPVLTYTYGLGLINGLDAENFGAESLLTLGQTLKIAATLHSLYYYGTADIVEYGEWYQAYADYALLNGIISLQRTIEPQRDYTATVTRAQFVEYLSKALPDAALETINYIADGAIPDVSMGLSYASHVYRLYRAGVLTGSDDVRSFFGTQYMKRSEAAAIVARMADPVLRMHF